MPIADIAANLPLKEINRTYTYNVPAELSFIDVGWRVFVPFGGRKVEGFVVNVREENEDNVENKIKLKNIISAVDDEQWFSKETIETCKKLSDFYLCSLAEMMRLFMPGKSGLKISFLYAINEENTNKILNEEPFASVYGLIKNKGAISKNDIEKNVGFDKKTINNSIEKMLRLKLIEKVYTAKKKASDLYETFIEKNSVITDDIIENFSKRKPAQARLLKVLNEKNSLSLNETKAEKISSDTVKKLEEAGFIRRVKKRIYRNSYKNFETANENRALTDEQKNAYAEIAASIKKAEYKSFLLFGVTGSGKTEVYIRAAETAIAEGRRVIVLVPEIGLTGQLVKSFYEKFAGDIAIIHSRLTVSERNDAMMRVKRNEAHIVIGARSALFTPAENVGLIILDEEHDYSYKQDESPRYHAKVVANILAKEHGATLVFGSATPSLETFYAAKTGEVKLLTLKRRIGDMPLPEVSCVDMRTELKSGNRRILSRPLEKLIKDTIAKKEQVIILLNRRGFSTFVLCRSCGEPLVCKDCGLPLVYHKNGSLACHHCDKTEIMPKTCPKCGSKYIKYFGSGTEKLEEELREIIPAARVIRMDRDTTTTKFAHSEILEKFKKGEYDILLGTQMVAKGHDVPNVTAVGIISADSTLHLPDFRAAERAFTLITQTSGRAGRHEIKEHLRGKVIVQCYNTEHYAVEYAAKNDYEGFYEKEIEIRKELSYPPFCRLVKLVFQGEDEEKTKGNAKKFIEKFKAYFNENDGNNAIGPAPALIANLRGIYRFVVLIKAKDLKKASEFLKSENMRALRDVAIDIDPIIMF
ncbi:MAG: primosomal protein N' [Selenomonadaceae bacterium]|nr:primosomal protein N' [Selenomonadaceae bacterium]MBP3723116.1 primosomal protein N' [Selenomonadaceae bacterium]